MRRGGAEGIWQVCQAVDIPVVGLGGIVSADDALQFLIAGACAVQVGTGLFVDPSMPVNVVAGIESYMKEQGFEHLGQLIGSLEV